MKLSQYFFNEKTIPITALFLASWGISFYDGLGRESPIVFDWLGRALMMWVVTWWVLRDDKRFGFRRIPDFGLFVAAFWVIFLPYYFIKTRGVVSLGKLLLMAIFLSIAMFLGMWMGSIYAATL